MEYLLGSTVTLIVVAAIAFFARRSIVENEPSIIEYSQSHIHQLIYPLVPFLTFGKKKEESQSTKHHDRIFLRVVVQGTKAYWIRDNIFYVADVNEDGQVDKENAKQVDTMSMDRVELDNIMEIVEKLTGEV